MKNILTLLTTAMLITATSATTSTILATNFNNLTLNQKNSKMNLTVENLKNWSMSSFTDHILTLYYNKANWMMNQKINNKVDEVLSNNKISQKKIKSRFRINWNINS